jgi:hypothetical protein
MSGFEMGNVVGISNSQREKLQGFSDRAAEIRQANYDTIQARFPNATIVFNTRPELDARSTNMVVKVHYTEFGVRQTMNVPIKLSFTGTYGNPEYSSGYTFDFYLPEIDGKNILCRVDHIPEAGGEFKLLPIGYEEGSDSQRVINPIHKNETIIDNQANIEAEVVGE